MSAKSIGLSAQLQAYVVEHSLPRDEVLVDLAGETQALGEVAEMQISAEEGAFLTLITKIMGARRAVEVGTFTGYSSLCIARGLGEGGSLLCCDVSQEWTDIARRYWARAGVDDRIELRIAPALETLQALAPEPVFDLAFLDADKTGYPAYWEELVTRVRPGGVLLVDNVLRDGRVVDPDEDDPDTTAIRSLNDRLVTDERVAVVMLPLADGVTMAVRR